MWNKIQIKRPIYPLISLAVSLTLLLCGLVVSMNPAALGLYLMLIALLYLFFGYGRVVLLCLGIFAMIGAVTSIPAMIQQAWLTAMVSIGRSLLLGLSSVPLITTPPILLTRAMTKARVPRGIALGLLVTIRFVPILRGEISRVRSAMKTRGVGDSWYRPATIYRAFLIPFMMQLINLSDMLSVSLETRGFDPSRNEAGIYKPVSVNTRDILFGISVLVVCAVSVAGRFVL